MSDLYVCKICNLKFKTLKAYQKHLSSKTHFEKINSIPIEKLNKPKKDNSSLTLDPYLDKEDIKKLESSTLGNSFKIQYKNDTVVNINYNIESTYNTSEIESTKTPDTTEITESILEPKEETEITESIQEPEIKKPIKEPEIKKPIQEKVVVTQKQIKILQFLIKFQNHKDLSTKTYQILQSIEITDLKGLITHIISTNSINIKNKQTILKIFKIFKQNLLKLKEKNIDNYKNKSIEHMISFITV
jgi:hypothetical protein